MYCQDLTGFTTAQYERGIKEFRKDWTYRRWPTIGELLRYFDRAKAGDQKVLPAPDSQKRAPLPGSFDADPAAYVAETQHLREENDRFGRLLKRAAE